MSEYGMTILVPGTVEEVKPQVQAALKTQGFGVLTEIDVQKTMKEKIGAEYEPFLILGACNPNLANQALTADRAIGLLLPCNVTLRQVGPNVEVSILDPDVMFSVVDSETKKKIPSLPQEAKKNLRAALASFEQHSAN
jgi:uncharacterized protein (DUF302 family)